MKDIERAIRDGFTSVMIDASHESFEDNVAITKRVVELAHPLGVSVEAELGTIGSTDNDKEVAGGATNIIYTKPEEAVKFVEETNCDCLAIAIGTAHGLYPKGFKPELKLELLKEIKKVVNVRWYCTVVLVTRIKRSVRLLSLVSTRSTFLPISKTLCIRN